MYQRGFASIVYKSFDKKTSGRDIKNEDMPDHQLPVELDKSIHRKFNEGRV